MQVEVYASLREFDVCIYMLFKTIILVSWIISCLEALEMKGNWIKWFKISFGGACGALKRKYKKKQDSRRLFSVQKNWRIQGCICKFRGKKCVYASLCK